MPRPRRLSMLFLTSFLFAFAADAAETAITVYNQQFAVVRESIPLELTQGENQVVYTGITAHLEPDSVILRDPANAQELIIIEQNYRADPISEALLLSIYEGRTIDFLVRTQEGSEYRIPGKIVRSGYVPHAGAYAQYGQQYTYAQTARAAGGAGQPLIEVEGMLRFGLPGQPEFPALEDDSILKPTLEWVISSPSAQRLDAELSYVTGGMSWRADYNLVTPEDGDVLSITGWVTLDNQTGKTFEEAAIKLVAGDVSKLRPQTVQAFGEFSLRAGGGGFADRAEPAVTEKSFDEYHLYTVARPTTLRDRETKQVEFLRADGIASERFYLYDGAKIDTNRYRGWGYDNIRGDSGYGTEMNTKVAVMREFMNTLDNQLGMPLPAGRQRFYRRDSDGQLEFIGENLIDHTSKDERVRVFTGNAFDVTGERVRKNYNIDHGQRTVDEDFEIKLRNHKTEPVEVRIVEHLYRGNTWEIVEKSNAFQKRDSETIEFRIQAPPDVEQILTYRVHYTW